jgi:hypothetical protein
MLAISVFWGFFIPAKVFDIVQVGFASIRGELIDSLLLFECVARTTLYGVN